MACMLDPRPEVPYGSCEALQASEMRWTTTLCLLGPNSPLPCPWKHKLKNPSLVGHTPGLSKEHAKEVCRRAAPSSFCALGFWDGCEKEGCTPPNPRQSSPAARPSRALKSERRTGWTPHFQLLAGRRRAQAHRPPQRTCGAGEHQGQNADPVPMSRMRVGPPVLRPTPQHEGVRAHFHATLVVGHVKRWNDWSRRPLRPMTQAWLLRLCHASTRENLPRDGWRRRQRIHFFMWAWASAGKLGTGCPSDLCCNIRSLTSPFGWRVAHNQGPVRCDAEALTMATHPLAPLPNTTSSITTVFMPTKQFPMCAP